MKHISQSEAVTGKISIPIPTKTILHVEDDDNYSILLECTLNQGGFKHGLHHVKDGTEAIAYLKGEGKYADRTEYPFPCVVLADLKMPRTNGFELLQWIRREPSMAFLPVVVLSCSDELKDVQKAYAMGANSFLIKPIQMIDLSEMLRTLESYWLKCNVLENQPRLRQ